MRSLVIKCTAGAEQVFDYRAPDCAERIMAATGGHGVDRIVEVAISANLETDGAVIAPTGTIATYGAPDGPPVVFPVVLRNSKANPARPFDRASPAARIRR